MTTKLSYYKSVMNKIKIRNGRKQEVDIYYNDITLVFFRSVLLTLIVLILFLIY